MKGAEVEFDLTGCIKLVKALDKMGVDAEPAANRAAQAAVKIVKRAVRSEAPVAKKHGGTLKKSIGQKKERTKFPSKRVYDVRFSPKYGYVLQKAIKRPGIYGGKNTKAYYPASQEYGFLTRKKGGSGMVYEYGRRFYKYDAIPDKGITGRDDLAEWYSKHGDDPGRSLRATGRTNRKKTWRGYVETVQGMESRKVEGQHYMRKGAEASKDQAQQIIIKTMEKELDKLWKEATHK